MCWWRELAAAHPTAKLILTVRDPTRWYASYCRLRQVGLCLLSPPYSWFLSLLGKADTLQYVKVRSHFNLVWFQDNNRPVPHTYSKSGEQQKDYPDTDNVR